MSHVDRYGRTWPNMRVEEYCDVCGQPDNCGDCEHEPLTDEQVVQLGGGLLTDMQRQLDERDATIQQLIVKLERQARLLRDAEADRDRYKRQVRRGY